MESAVYQQMRPSGIGGVTACPSSDICAFGNKAAAKGMAASNMRNDLLNTATFYRRMRPASS
jgi:hypothetical protein